MAVPTGVRTVYTPVVLSARAQTLFAKFVAIVFFFVVRASINVLDSNSPTSTSYSSTLGLLLHTVLIIPSARWFP